MDEGALGEDQFLHTVAGSATRLGLGCVENGAKRAAGIIAGTGLAKATTATIRRKLVAVPARITRRSRRLILHLPENWKWEPQWSRLLDHTHDPPAPVAT